MKRVLFLLLWCSSLSAQKPAVEPFAGAIQPAVFALSKVMMHDVVNPPAASRYYAYCLLGAYEIMSHESSTLPYATTFMRNYTMLQQPIPKAWDKRIAALFCILQSGRRLLPSGFMLEEDIEALKQSLLKQKVSKATIEASLAVAEKTADHIVAFSKRDGYNKLSARLRYTPPKGDGMWYPTPPTYIEAVEPHWRTVQPLLIDSCNEAVPPRPVAFSKDSSSAFFALAKEVYDVSKTATEEQLAMAAFWDCNPFAVSTSGHLSLGFKKISPGGHWMSIAGIAATKAALSFEKSILLHTLVAATLMDAFIACWDEKYRSNRIRPETYINRQIDKKWQPLLQTPPFPEYPSGHSVISTASAEVMTFLLGDGFSYTDDSEDMFDLAPRSFTSFRHAAAEAAISRLYGGIHFRDAIEAGQVEGAAVATKIIAKLKAAGVGPLR